MPHPHPHPHPHTPTHTHTHTHTHPHSHDCPLWWPLCVTDLLLLRPLYSQQEDIRTEIHSLALFMRPISFSSLMARAMSPLMRSFPDMNASVGFRLPKTQSTQSLLWRPGCCHVGPTMTELTGKHFAEVAGVHLHDNVGFDGGLARACAATAAFQVKEPGSCMVT